MRTPRSINKRSRQRPPGYWYTPAQSVALGQQPLLWKPQPTVWVTIYVNPTTGQVTNKEMTMHTLRRYIKQKLSPKGTRSCRWCAERNQPCKVKDKGHSNRFTHRELQFEKRWPVIYEKLYQERNHTAHNYDALNDLKAKLYLEAFIEAGREFGLFWRA